MSLAATGALIVLAAWNLTILVPYTVGLVYAWGADYRFYVEHAQTWLDGGGFYLPHQLTGPYEVVLGRDVLYPPFALWLFVPFTVLPAILWWAIPIAMVVWSLRRLRPAIWAWPALAFVAWYPVAEAAFVRGSTTVWIFALLMVGVAGHWWAVPMTLVKPSFLPFVALGIRDRRWWIGLGTVVLLAIPFGGLWIDYASAIRNGGPQWTYSLLSYPILVVPVIVWAARRGRDAS